MDTMESPAHIFILYMPTETQQTLKMDDSDNTLLFSDYRTQVIGFASTTSDIRQRNVRHQEIATDPMPSTREQGTATNVSSDIGIQTIGNSLMSYSGGVMASVDEKYLLRWLLQILPMVENELLLGPTPMTNLFSTFLSENHVDNDGWNAVAHQIIQLKNTSDVVASQATTASSASVDLTHGCAAWMSVVTQNAPMLAMAGSFAHSAWCDHNDATVEVFMPKRHKETGNIFFTHFQTLAAKSCVQCLETNPRNKDWLAGGSYSGDVSVWIYERGSSHASNEDQVVQVPCDLQSQYGCVVGMAWLMWLPSNKAGSADIIEYGLLSAHADGMIVLWRIVTAKQASDGNEASMTREKIFSIKSIRNAKETARISAITALSADQFVVGTETGNVYVCSISQATVNTTGGSNDRVRSGSLPQQSSPLVLFNPIVGEMSDVHQFAVTSLRLAEEALHDKDHLFISTDVSGEVFIRRRARRSDTDDSSIVPDEQLIAEAPWQILRMPVRRLRKCVRVSRDGRRLFCADSDGGLEWFSVNGRSSMQLVTGKCTGSGGFVALSDNESWIITGMYDERSFQLFHVQTQI